LKFLLQSWPRKVPVVNKPGKAGGGRTGDRYREEEFVKDNVCTYASETLEEKGQWDLGEKKSSVPSLGVNVLTIATVNMIKD